MSSREMMMKAGKEVAKSVVVAKAAQIGANRLGLTAIAGSVGMATWGAGLLIARKIHPQYLDPVSSNQINRDPEFVMNCHIIVKTKDTVKHEDVVETMEFYVKNFDRFRERVVVRQWMWPYWEQMENMDINAHIFFDATPKDHEGLMDYCSSSLTQGMNPLMPLWKIVVFTNFTFEDGTKGNAILFKYHHCMGDGFSLARTMFSFDPDNVLLPPKPNRAGLHQPGTIGAKVGKFGGAVKKLLSIQDDPPSSVKAANLLAPLATRIACAQTSQAPIQDIKKAAKARNFTINDMVLGALSAALRKYQIDKGMPLVDPLAGVWVALKPIGKAFAKQGDINTVPEPGNKNLGCVYVRLPVVKDLSRPDRVQAVCDEISQLKGSPEPLLAQQFMKMFGLLPTLISNPIWNALSNKISLSVSNLPGPPPGWKFCGVEMQSFSVWVPPVGTISTFALITSYHDRITLSLAMDGTIFSKEDGKALLQNFDDELCQLASSGMQPTSKL
jgi:hypothetical protein